MKRKAIEIIIYYILFSIQLSTAPSTNAVDTSNDNNTILILENGNIGAINSSNCFILSADNTNSERISETVFRSISFAINFVNKNISSMLLLVLVIIIYYWIRRDDEMIIMPFEVANIGNEYNGKFISEMLAAELLRISHIHSTVNKVTKNLNDGSLVVTVETPKLTPELGKISFIPAQGITIGEPFSPNIGTIPIGSASVSIGEFLVEIKKFFRGTYYRPLITGSLYTDSRKIQIAVCLNGCRPFSSEAKKQTDRDAQNDFIDDFDRISRADNESGLIFDLIRDLSFKIVYELGGERQSLKTLLGFKYYTEALDNYKQYMLTKQIDFLNRASENSIEGINIEKNENEMFDLLINLGIAYFTEKMNKKAENMFIKAIELNSQSAIAWFYRGMILDYQGEYDKGIKAYDEALQIDPNLAQVWNSKGWIFYEQGKYGHAIDAYDRAIELDSKSAIFWNNKGLALFAKGEYDAAIKAYDKSISYDSNLGAALNNKGYALNENGNRLYTQGKQDDAKKSWNKAIEICDQVISRDTDYSVALNNKAYALNRLGYYDDAIWVIDRTIELNPNYATSWNNKGYALIKQGRYDESVKVLDKAIELNPNNPETWDNIGEALNELGRSKESLAAFAKADELRFFSIINPQK